MENKPVIRMKNVSKEFPGAKALNDVSLDFYPGEVHVIVGENGAGKSTLIKILSGVYSFDTGSIEYKGNNIKFNSPKHAMDSGISVIHQELSVVPDLTVAENIFLGREIKKNGIFLDKGKINRISAEILKNLDLNINTKTKIEALSIANMQMVEIAKAISQKASVVIMDEPTSSISEHEVQALFRTIKKLKNSGVSIIYISHRLKELYEIGDKITVLRDGRLIKTLPIKETNEDILISLMVGREIKNYFNKEKHIINEIVLELKGLTKKNEYDNISLELRKGEILGISGLVGAGRTELLRGIFGVEKHDKGEIYLRGKKINFKSPNQAIKHRVGLVPEDRRLQGILVEEDVKRNISLPSIISTAKYGLLNKKWEKRIALEYVKKLSIKTPSIDTQIKSLSGGNQQKVVLAKWLVANSDILLLDEPTRGIDVNAKSEIYALINDFTQKGGSVILVSSDLPEILGICDRIIVMREGQITGMTSREEASEEKVMKLASLN